MEQTLANQNLGRIVHHETFHDKGFTTNNSLAAMRMTKSDTINPVITHLMGAESKKFPLSFLTEGQKGGLDKKSIEDVEYNWDVIGLMKISDTIVSTEYTTGDTPAIGGLAAEIVFKGQWLKQQHTIHSPNGVQCRIQGRPVPVANGFKYRVVIIDPALEFIPLEELTPNTRWAMVGGAAVSEAGSSGNESNSQAPGKIKNQISILRKSYSLGGNVSNRTVEFQFNIGGKTTSKWMPWEEYQHEKNFKQACEEHLWWSKYNRDSKGNIITIDEETGYPIPIGGGVADQIVNEDTYGVLTVNKLKNTVRDVMFGATDSGKMDIVLFTGTGGMDDFDAAIKKDATGSGGWEKLLQGNVADKFITGAAGTNQLNYGAYFTTYRHIDGHTITVKHLMLLDQGGRADNAPRHRTSNLPLTSHEMYFIDMSTYDGERNVQMITQEGRSMIRGLEQGMTLVKGTKGYGDYSGNNLNVSTDQDKTSVHFLKTLGICIRRNTHCFKLFCDQAA